MKRVLFGLLLSLLAISGCNRSQAPEKDATGATPTRRVLTVKVTGDTENFFMAIKRGDGHAVFHENLSLPYEQTFTAEPGEAFNFTVFGGTPKESVKANLRIVVIYDGQEVSSGVESDRSAGLPPLLSGNEKMYAAECGFTVPSS